MSARAKSRQAPKRLCTFVAPLVLIVSCGDDGAESPSSTSAPERTTTQVEPTSTSTTSTTAVARPVTTAPQRADPEAIAQRITRAEVALRDADTEEGDFAASAREQQAAYRAVSAAPELFDDVMARVPGRLREAARSNATAATELRKLTKPRTELPPWRIVPPAPADELFAHYREAEGRYAIPWRYLAAIHLVETRMGRIRGTSTAGAQGPMQFMPATWEQYGEGGDINDNRDSIMAAARYLKRNGGPERMSNALYAYNHSDRYVRAVTLYAEQMTTDRAYRAYWHWEVWYRMTRGDVMLPVGYDGSRK